MLNSIQPLVTLFEQTVLLYFAAAVLQLRKDTGINTLRWPGNTLTLNSRRLLAKRMRVMQAFGLKLTFACLFYFQIREIDRSHRNIGVGAIDFFVL